MVVKPWANLTRAKKGLAQPGIKVRGREYLRIIYGPDYTEPRNLERLRDRNLGHERSLALREYALGLEALERTARDRTAVASARGSVRSARHGIGASRPSPVVRARRRRAEPRFRGGLGSPARPRCIR